MQVFHLQEQAVGHYHPEAISELATRQLGTLGTGNHFVELTVNELGGVGILIHSGSRGLGNKIGSHFIRVAKEFCDQTYQTLPDPDLAFLMSGTQAFNDYMFAVNFAQAYAWENRLLMLHAAREIIERFTPINNWGADTVHCHHNYIAEETHYGEELFITRKGAVRAQIGDMGIIPGSMGARTYIVEGLGSTDSFCSCSHGAGRVMSRTEAKKHFTVEDHIAATAGVECDKTAGTLDETPGAYKPIDDVLAAESDLVKPLFTMKQFLCVKGIGQEKKWQKRKSQTGEQS